MTHTGIRRNYQCGWMQKYARRTSKNLASESWYESISVYPFTNPFAWSLPVKAASAFAASHGSTV